MVRPSLRSQKVYEDYFTSRGLAVTTGLAEGYWDSVIFKELLDNALDAIDGLKNNKSVLIRVDKNALGIFDNGPGVSEETLSGVYDFRVYTSSNRLFRSLARGMQGNALKSIIGISYVKKYKLTFQIAGGLRLSYKMKNSESEFPEFEREELVSENSGSGVMIEGIENMHGLLRKIRESLLPYRLANPDVTFIYEDEASGERLEYRAVSRSISRTAKTYTHWYDLDSFAALLKAYCQKYPNVSVIDFCHRELSGTRGEAVGQLPFRRKKLSEILDEGDNIKHLHQELTARVTKGGADLLRGGLAGKDALVKIYYGNDPKEYRYTSELGEYKSAEALIPYAIEGALMHNGTNEEFQVIIAVNNSVPYEHDPFTFSFDRKIRIHRKHEDWSYRALTNVLREVHLFEAKGLTLYLHLVTPHIEFFQHSKAQILGDGFVEGLEKVVDEVCKYAYKESEKTWKTPGLFDPRSAIIGSKPATTRKEEKKTKIGLMREYFLDGLRKQSGDFHYKAKIRQIFYEVRSIILRNYNINEYGKSYQLTDDDYKVFSQKVATEFIRNNPELSKHILFEARGHFYPPVGGDLPLSTQDVQSYIEGLPEEAGIFYTAATGNGMHFRIPVELQYNQILFCEKTGFYPIFKESGLLEDLNMGYATTQGLGTRAFKELARYLESRGIKIYVLCDCDLWGHIIYHQLVNPSPTWSNPLEKATRIGLTYPDVKKLKKEKEYAEEYVYPEGKGIKEAKLKEILGQDGNEDYEVERNFFVVDLNRGKYRRVELNALSTPEIIDYVREKIEHKPIKPRKEQLERCVDFNPESIIMESLRRVFGANLNINVSDYYDRGKIIEIVYDEIQKNGKGHWSDILRNQLKTAENRIIDQIVEDLKKRSF